MVSSNPVTRVFGLVVGLGMFTVAAAPAQAPMAIAKEVKVSPGELSGKILQSGTRAPAEAHTMTIRTMDGQKVAEVVTRANGTYTTPPLADGQYVMEVAKGMNLQLNVGPGATIKSLDIVVPQQALAAAQPQPAQPAQPANPAAGAEAPAAPGGAAGAQGVGAQGVGGAAAGDAGAAVGAGAGAGAGAGGGLGIVGWGLIGLGAAAAVAVPVAIAENNKSERVVSPVTPPARLH